MNEDRAANDRPCDRNAPQIVQRGQSARPHSERMQFAAGKSNQVAATDPAGSPYQAIVRQWRMGEPGNGKKRKRTNGGTDCHASDLGPWLAMTDGGMRAAIDRPYNRNRYRAIVGGGAFDAPRHASDHGSGPSNTGQHRGRFSVLSRRPSSSTAFQVNTENRPLCSRAADGCGRKKLLPFLYSCGKIRGRGNAGRLPALQAEVDGRHADGRVPSLRVGADEERRADCPRYMLLAHAVRPSTGV